MKIKQICEYCKKEFEDYSSNNRRFCSQRCFYNTRKGKPFLHRINPCFWKGKHLPQEMIDKIHTFSKGHIPWNKGKKIGKQSLEFIKKRINARRNYKHSKETKIKIGLAHKGKKITEETRQKLIKSHIGLNIGEKHPNWLGGLSYEPYTPNFNQQLKDRIRVRDNFICQLCSIPELECNRRLSIHHIDFNKKNSNENNLIALCNKCNTKVNRNRKYWAKYFQNKKEVVNEKV